MIKIRYILSIKVVLTRRRSIETTENIEHRRLSRSRRTDEGKIIISLNFNINSVESSHKLRAHLIVLGNVFKIYDRSVIPHSLSR